MYKCSFEMITFDARKQTFMITIVRIQFFKMLISVCLTYNILFWKCIGQFIFLFYTTTNASLLSI